MHASTEIKAPSSSIAQPCPNEQGEGETYWLAFVRMVGLTTASCSGVAVLLHAGACELAGESTHWIASALLTSIAATSFFALFQQLGNSRISPQILAGLGGVSSALMLVFGELCYQHFGLSWLMLCINVLAFWFMMRGSD